MRVAEILEATIGGTRRHLLDLATHLDRAQFDLELICSTERDPGFRDELESLRAAGVGVTIVPMARSISPWRDWRAYRLLKRRLREGRFGLVHTHSSKAGFLGRLAAYRLGIPIVHTPHAFAFQSGAGRLQRWLYRTLERWAARWCEAIIAVSPGERQAALYAGICAPGKLRLIPNGVDLAWLDAQFDRAAARRELGLADSHLAVGSIGRLTSQKGYRYLIEAARLVAREIPNVRFPIIGEGEEHRALESLIGDRGLGEFVRLLGHRDQAASLCAGFDLFVLPSLWEGAPYALLEAMAAGLPVVATRVAGNADLVVEGKTGLLVPPRDPPALARAIAELLRDPVRRAMIGRRGREQVERNCSLAEQIAATERLYLEMAEASGADRQPGPSVRWDAIKAVLDRFAAGAAMIALAPMLVTVGLLVKLDSPGPILFRQWRVGKRGRRFLMYKFRSMHANAEQVRAQLEEQQPKGLPFFKLEDDPRVCPLGRLLRKLALDELPQLFNVLRGEMSLVGPRPLPSRDLEECGWLMGLPPGELERRRRWRELRASVKPGVTGLWQVSGRSELDFDGWIVNDLDYVARRSLLLDLAILWRTPLAMWRGRR